MTKNNEILSHQVAIVVGGFGVKWFPPPLCAVLGIDGYHPARGLGGESSDQQDVLAGGLRLESDHFEATRKGWKEKFFADLEKSGWRREIKVNIGWRQKVFNDRLKILFQHTNDFFCSNRFLIF